MNTELYSSEVLNYASGLASAGWDICPPKGKEDGKQIILRLKTKKIIVKDENCVELYADGYYLQTIKMGEGSGLLTYFFGLHDV